MKLTKAFNLIRSYLDLLLVREKPHAFPVELSLGTTSFCNLKCIHCPREESDGNLVPYDEHLDMPYFEEFQPYLQRATEVSLYGLGEPMIDRNYFEKVRYVTSFGGNVGLSSNGTLLDEKRCREVVVSGVKGIGISLDASTENVFKIVRPPGGLPKIVENIKRLQRVKQELNSMTPVVKLSYGVMRQNLQDLPSFPELAADVGCKEIIVHPIIFMSENMKNTMSADQKEMLEVVDETRKNAESLGIICHYWNLDPMTFLKSVKYANETNNQASDFPNHPEKNSKKPSHFCYFLWRNAMVQGKGELFPCCYITNIRLGQVDNGNLRELLGHPFMASLRRDLYNGQFPPPCANCPQLHPYNRWNILKGGVKELYRFLVK